MKWEEKNTKIFVVVSPFVLAFGGRGELCYLGNNLK